MADDDSTEVWLPVPLSFFCDFYAVSNMGRVRCTRARQGCGKGALRALERRRDGYVYVSFTQNGAKRVVAVHRLVALAHLGRAKDMQVNHKNGVKHDNRAENLEWVTPSENALHALHELGNFAHRARGARHGMAKLTPATVREARSLAASGLSQRKIATRLGVSRRAVRQAIDGTTWSHVA